MVRRIAFSVGSFLQDSRRIGQFCHTVLQYNCFFCCFCMACIFRCILQRKIRMRIYEEASFKEPQ